MKNFLNKFKYFILGGVVVLTGTVYAVNITVPSAPGPGYFLQSLSTGAYGIVSLTAGSNITISTSTTNFTISSNGSSSVGPRNVLQASDGAGGFIATGTPQLTVGNLLGTSTTATSILSGPFRLPALSQGSLYVGSTGLLGTTATTTVTCAGTASCTTFVAFGSSPVTITGSGSGASDFSFLTNFNNLTAATSSKVWLQNTLYASSTIQFDQNTLSVPGFVKYIDWQRDQQSISDNGYTLMRIRAPKGQPNESTLTLYNDIRGDNSDIDVNFIDFYNEDYSDSLQGGIRVFNTGVARQKPFVFGYKTETGSKDAQNVFGMLPSGTVFLAAATSTVDQTTKVYIASSTATTLLKVDSTPSTTLFTIKPALSQFFNNASTSAFSATRAWFNFFDATSTSATSTIANALRITAGQPTGSSVEGTIDGTLNIQNTTSPNLGLQVYTNAGAETDSPLVLFRSDNTAFDDGVLWLLQDGTSGGAYNAKLQGPAPQIEWVESDQASPAGKFEDGVNGDIRYIASRNSGDSAFENAFEFDRYANGGGFRQLGTGISYFTGKLEARANASTTGISAGYAYFGTTATTSISNSGQISLCSTCFLRVGANPIIGPSGSATLIRPTGSGGDIEIQSFAGAVNTYFKDTGFVGVASTTPWGLLSVNPNALGSGVPEFVVGSSTATHFVIVGNGNVGIGQSVPSQKLEVVGNIFLNAAGTGLFILSRGAVTNFSGLQIATNGNPAWTIGGRNDSTENLHFFNENTSLDSMTILASNSNVGISTSTPTYVLNPFSSTAPQLALSAGAGLAQWTMRSTGNAFYIASTTVAGTATSTTASFGILPSGVITFGNYANCTGTNALQISGTQVVCGSVVSDKRLKTDINSIKGGVETIMKLKPVSYYWKDLTYHNTTDPREQYGFIAQDLEEVIPSAVGESPDGYKTADLTRIIPYLVDAVQQLAKEKGVAVKETAEEKWQWGLIGGLIIWNMYLTFVKKRTMV